MTDTLPPVDRENVCTTRGGDPEEVRKRQREEGNVGQHSDYIVLCDEEREKGFVRPVRNSYRHLTCGGVTTMGTALAETCARDPGFYGRTFCCACNAHFPVGAEGEFEWLDGSKVGT